MSESDSVVESIEQASALERRAFEYYKRAVEEAGSADAAHTLQTLLGHHQTHIERLHARREAIQRERRHGFFAEAVESLGEAIAGVLAGLPVEFIEEKTDPSIALLIRLEERLLAHYETMVDTVDEHTATLVRSAIDDGRRHLAQLHTLDPLA